MYKLKYILLKVMGYLLYFTGIYYALDKIFNNKGLYILMYHRISDRNDNSYFQDISVKKEEFEKQLQFFTKKYCCISMSEAISIIKQNGRMNKNYVVFTFDDGYRDNITHGALLTSKYNIRPIVYITAGKIETNTPIWTEIIDYVLLNSKKKHIDIDINGIKIKGNIKDKKGLYAFADEIKGTLKKVPQKEIRKHIIDLNKICETNIDTINNELLNWESIYELKKMGWEIGSHTLNHVNLALETENIILDEIIKSRELIENRLKCEVEHFAYPFGKSCHYNQFAINEISANYKSAVTTILGTNTCKDNVYLLRRIAIGNHHSLCDIKVRLLISKIRNVLKFNR